MEANEISVVIPVYNGGPNFARCLDALAAVQPTPLEVIIVDDGSTDGSREQATGRGLSVLQTERGRSGPAIARNVGAAFARGEILFFVDADVMLPRDAIARIVAAFEDGKASAIFGSYDDAPGDKSFVSQYKNLFHHYVHQTSRGEATSFWAGCGAIRKEVFRRMGGFSPAYPRPSIEDIELGYRLRREHYNISLIKDLQVKHLKRWTLRSLLVTDIFNRAIPWAELILREHELPTDLNLRPSHRISTLLCFLLILAFFGALLSPSTLFLVPILGASLLILNLGFYRFFYHKRGLMFAVRAIPLHWLYYLYSGTAFGMVLLLAFWRRLTGMLEPSQAHSTQINVPR